MAWKFRIRSAFSGDAVKGRSTHGILAFGSIVSRHGAARSRATAVVTVMTTAAVSVGGMGPPVLAALGRRTVVTPRVGWL